MKSFTSSSKDGDNPIGNLFLGSDDSFYDIMPNGGSSSLRTIFRATADGSTFSILKSFTISDGFNPLGSLMQGNA